MSRFSMPWSAISVVALAMLVGCSCDKVEHDLLACQDQLAKSQPVSAFTLEINNDSFATFQPFNNQYRNNPSPAAHRHGFLVQVGDFWRHARVHEDRIAVRQWCRPQVLSARRWAAPLGGHPVRPDLTGPAHGGRGQASDTRRRRPPDIREAVPRRSESGDAPDRDDPLGATGRLASLDGDVWRKKCRD